TEIEDRLVTRTLKALITANNSFIPTFIGTRASTADPSVKNEGRSSWDTDMFTKSGSPFFIGGVVNFSAYMANNGFAACDIAIIHLGSNDAYRITKEAYEANLKTLITSLWAYNPNMEVILSMPTLGSVKTSDGNYIKTITVPFIEQAKTGFVSYSSPNSVPVTLCPSYMAVNRARDWGYVFPTEQRDGQPFVYDSMHLNSTGYTRIADMMFSAIMYALNN
ncbi:SGNH/GDSL hydrolase family protein, partial [Dyadobacter sp. CY261]|uniref:SGNH/GDSL hydrolase family protein n=1 Tax=Dyadobacter sp. CY261 TaxID=2907203 RepID=UPI001F276FF1